ncbi:hypothetical protein FSP39_021126 [Pinctada imbricata]|uniref:MULE transposase domain-containing protein n=1 Tax=Pinctada imbricata TaxID=66713 RepID=A0AA88YUG3_PINIB|nr:hypothetical protein FSP39_021126 [Pinctada imbricata]
MTGPVQTSLEKTGPRPPVLSECQSDSSGDNIYELATAGRARTVLRTDIRVDNERHLIFATDRQLGVLATAKTWYIDATFKVVRAPIYQMLSVHAFIRSGSEIKQVPLAFALLSRRRTKDYIAVYKAIVRLLPHAPQVKVIVMDLEAAMWAAARRVMPTCTLRGCAFHWAQAVWRKCQKLGLQVQILVHNIIYKPPSGYRLSIMISIYYTFCCSLCLHQVPYTKIDRIHKFIRLLMALPYLPKEHILPA